MAKLVKNWQFQWFLPQTIFHDPRPGIMFYLDTYLLRLLLSSQSINLSINQSINQSIRIQMPPVLIFFPMTLRIAVWIQWFCSPLSSELVYFALKYYKIAVFSTSIIPNLLQSSFSPFSSLPHFQTLWFPLGRGGERINYIKLSYFSKLAPDIALSM